MQNKQPTLTEAEWMKAWSLMLLVILMGCEGPKCLERVPTGGMLCTTLGTVTSCTPYTKCVRWEDAGSKQ